MRVLLAGPDYEENLSIRYLSASLRSAGHETILATFNSLRDAESVSAAARHADVVGLSMCFQSRALEFLRLAQIVKARDPHKLIAAGGHYASCAAEPLIANHPEIDVIVLHEGEETLVEIADAMPWLNERLPGIAGIAYRDGVRLRFTERRRTVNDLDSLAFPDRRGPIHSIAGVRTSYMMGSRGCYENCAYCCITTLHRIAPGKRFRQRTVDNIADEMASLYHERGTRQFVFHDDNFLIPSVAQNHARIASLQSALGSRGVQDIALVIKCRPADADRDVLRRLKDLGLVRIFLGVESATPRGLFALERRQTVDDSVRALETCAELDISAQFTLMIFRPDATLETMRSDMAFMRRFSGNPLNFCRTEIYSGTPLEQRMIAIGRARGDYLARVYCLADPIADRACDRALDVFEPRCWSSGSLMQNAIGLDHTAAVLKRFNAAPEALRLCERVSRWLRAVNLDTTALLEEVIEVGSSADPNSARRLEEALERIKEKELGAREDFLREAAALRTEINNIRALSSPARESHALGLKWAKQVAAAMLAIGVPAVPGTQQVLAQQVEAFQSAKPSQENQCSVSGTVSDRTGAVIANATMTITSLSTDMVRTVKTDRSGRYAASDLAPGRYTIKAEATAFKMEIKSGIVLREGDAGHTDLTLNVREDIGCCEYAAVPLKTQRDLIYAPKPFTYYVGEGDDHAQLAGIAKLVYGDSSGWVPIYEANREKIDKPTAALPFGTELVIPPNRRVIPKLISKVMPVYPPEERKAGVKGDVIMDVVLKPNGGVEAVHVIDGPSELADAAVAAIKQWRYRPLVVKGKAIDEFIVVISFDRGVKIR